MKTLKRLVAISTLVVLGLIQLMPSALAAYTTVSSNENIDNVDNTPMLVDSTTDSNGDIHLITYLFNANLELRYYKYSGGSWSSETILKNFNGTGLNLADAKIDEHDGTVWVIWTAGGEPGEMKYKKYSGGSWGSETTVISDIWGTRLDFSITSDGIPYLAFTDGSSNLRTTKWTGSAFSVADQVASIGMAPASMGVETTGSTTTGELHVAVQGDGSGGPTSVKYYETDIVGGDLDTWDSVETLLSSQILNPAGQVGFINTGLSADNRFRFVSTSINGAKDEDDRIFYLSKNSGGTWNDPVQFLDTGAPFDEQPGRRAGLFTDTDGTIYVAYSHMTESDILEMKYSSNEGSTWGSMPITTTGAAGDSQVVINKTTSPDQLVVVQGGHDANFDPGPLGFLFKSFYLTEPEEGASVPEFKTYMLILTLMIGMGLIYKAMPKTVRSKA